MNEQQRQRFGQAREAFAEAQALQDAGMDLAFVLNNLYLSCYYSIVALVHGGRVPETMQSVTIGLFDQQFVATGKIDGDLAAAVHRLFDLKPRCSGNCSIVTSDELALLFRQAELFIIKAEEVAQGTG